MNYWNLLCMEQTLTEMARKEFLAAKALTGAEAVLRRKAGNRMAYNAGAFMIARRQMMAIDRFNRNLHRLETMYQKAA